MDSMNSISFLNEPLISWKNRRTFLDHFCHQFWVGATAKQHQTHPKVITKMAKKCSMLCSTDQRFIQKRNTNHKIHTLNSDSTTGRTPFVRMLWLRAPTSKYEAVSSRGRRIEASQTEARFFKNRRIVFVRAKCSSIRPEYALQCTLAVCKYYM